MDRIWGIRFLNTGLILSGPRQLPMCIYSTVLYTSEFKNLIDSFPLSTILLYVVKRDGFLNSLFLIRTCVCSKIRLEN